MRSAARQEPVPGERAPWWLILLSSAFLAVIALLVAASFLRPDPPPEFSPGDGPRGVEADGTAWGRYTLDARDPDRWRFFSFDRGELGSAERSDAWDLAVRRFRVVVNGGPEFPGRGGARELGDQPLTSLRDLPSGGYAETRGSLAQNPVNPALEDWYSYGFVTHLLRPRPTTFAVRTADGRYAALRILSYYCPGADPGCLTFAFVWQPEGGRRLSPPASDPSFQP